MLKAASSRIGCLLGMLMVVATAGQSNAAILTTYSHIHGGQVCQPGQGSESKIVYTQSEGVRNINTTSTATLYCPIDSVVVKSGTDFPGAYKALRVRVLDRNTTTNISCTLKSYTTSGILMTTFPTRSSTGSSSSIQTLEWNSSNNTFSNNHTFRVSCTLPLGTTSTSQSTIVQVEADIATFQ